MKLRAFSNDQLPKFAKRLGTISNFLPEEELQELKSEVQRLIGVERTYLPAHKKGGTISYSTLREVAPKAIELYHSPEYQKLLSSIVGEKLVPTPLQDESSLSILVYNKSGDHIGWHYDHNFYNGLHFTVLLAIENKGKSEDGLSSARLMVRDKQGDTVIPTPPNTLVVFEGSKILHQASKIDDGETRIMLSMTYCTNPKNSLVKEWARRIKDTAFFGVRALWAKPAKY
jgi:hypothetical protein